MEPEVKATKSGTEDVPPAVHSSEPSLPSLGNLVYVELRFQPIA